MVERTKLTAADFYQLPEYETETLIELIDGEVVIRMAPIPKHQDIVGEIFYTFKTIVKQKGGRTYSAPIEVYLDDMNVFEPDVLYLKPDSKCEVGDKRLMGAPDLVVEVLSPSTAKYDRQAKYQTYERHGVGEYWIVDPVHEVIEVWTIGESRQFKRQGAFADDDTFESVTLGESVTAKAIFDV